MKTLEELRAAYNAACERVQEVINRLDELEESEKKAQGERAKMPDSDRAAAEADARAKYEAINADLGVATEAADAAEAEFKSRESLERSRSKYKPDPAPAGGGASIRVNEPDLYTKDTPLVRGFLRDVYMRDVRHDHAASERLSRHQEYELGRIEAEVGEQRAVATATLGGAIPPQYLVDLYAKALRNGRVYANQANHMDLPDTGMSLIVPRFTTGLAAGIQASESATLTTQDPVEADLTVPVRTVGGYS